MEKIEAKKAFELTGHRSAIYGITRGEKPSLLYSAGGDGWVVCWDLEHPDQGKVVARTQEKIFCLHYLHKSASLVAGDMTGGIHWIDCLTPENGKNIQQHQQGVFAFFENELGLFSLGGDGTFTKWDVLERKARESLQLTNKPLRSITPIPKTNEAILGASDNHLYRVDLSRMELTATVQNAHENSIFSLAVSDNGALLYSGGRDALLRCRSIDQPARILHSLPAHWYTINALALHPSGRFLASGSRDKTIKIWSIPDLQLLKVLAPPKHAGHLNSVNRLLWIPEKDLLLSAGDDRKIIAWEVRVIHSTGTDAAKGD